MSYDTEPTTAHEGDTPANHSTSGMNPMSKSPITECASTEAASDLDTVRRRIRTRLHEKLSLDPTGNNAVWILLYNWARGLPAERGFSPSKRASNNAGDHVSRTLLRLLKPASTKFEIEALTHGEPENAKELARRDLRAWSMSATREILMPYFESMPAGTPGMRTLALAIAAATPHGPQSDAHAHGKDALGYFFAILTHLQAITKRGSFFRPQRYGMTQRMLETVKLPSWAADPENAKRLLHAMWKFPMAEIRAYLEGHDCGKAFCMTIDPSGKPHYPGHAQISARIWAKAGGTPLECELMAKDMLVHTVSASDCQSLSTDPLVPILMLAGLAEVHANAEKIFGGLESESFTIKFKQLDRRGKALMRGWTD